MSSRTTSARLRDIKDRARQLEFAESKNMQIGAGNDRPIVLFGAGPLGQQTLAHLREVGIAPVAIVDNAAARWGGALDGVPILSPPEAARRYATSGRFLVTVYNGSAVRRQLKALGCEFVEHFANLYFEHEREFLPFCALAARSVILDAWREVAAAACLWHDEKSSNEYLAQLAWRLRIPNSDLPPPDSPSQCYFARELFDLLKEEVFLDCGAYDGDSLRQYLAVRPPGASSSVVALEPDAASFKRLSEFVGTLPAAVAKNISIRQLAIAERTGMVAFAALGSVRSAVVEAAEKNIPATSIDDIELVPT